MGMHTTKVAVGEGKFALEAQLTVTPRGMAVYACSPEFAHLGATAQAIPRPEPGRTATVSILAVPCHSRRDPGARYRGGAGHALWRAGSCKHGFSC